MLLEAWRSAEAQAESAPAEDRAAAVQAVEKRMPKRIKRKVMHCLFSIRPFVLCIGSAKQSNILPAAVALTPRQGRPARSRLVKELPLWVVRRIPCTASS